MRTYGQYCPIARGAEIFAERWTPIIMRNILMGCETFTEIQRGAPGIPRSLLTQRLALLERQGIVERWPNDNGRGARYLPTDAGRGLANVCFALGEWGARWLDVAPDHLDPYVALSDGSILQMSVHVVDDPTDVQNVTYVVHAPAGTRMVGMAFPNHPSSYLESVRFVTDTGPG